MTRAAANGIGWNIEWLSPSGWVAVNRVPFVDREQADAYLACCDPEDGETRVYEALGPRRRPAPWPLQA